MGLPRPDEIGTRNDMGHHERDQILRYAQNDKAERGQNEGGAAFIATGGSVTPSNSLLP
jgi:hypothetical protein